MLSLHIDNRPVELPPDFSVTMNLKSPVFGDVGSYSYPFKIPNSPRNAITFGFRHRVPNTTNPYLVQQGYFAWKNIGFIHGTTKMRIFNDQYLEGNIFEGSGNFNYLRKNNALQDVDFGTYSYASESARLSFINSCFNKFYPERDICFPQIQNKSYFEELPVNTGLHYFNNYINGQITAQYTGGVTQRTLIVPMLYVRFVLQKIIEHIGYAFDDLLFTTHPDFNSLALFNLVDCNSGPSGYFKYDLDKIYLNYHLPRMSMNDFLSGIEDMFNARFFINTTTKKISLVSINSIVNSEYFTDFSKNIISVSTEIDEQITGYNLQMTMDTDDELFEARKQSDENKLARLKDSVQSFSDLNAWPADDILDLRYVLDANTYYIMWSNKQWIPWVDTLDLSLQYRYRTNQQTIETKFSTLLNDQPGDDAIVGNARENWKKVTGKLFFVNHVPNGPIGAKMVANPISSSSSLYYGGSTGLFTKHFQSYFDFRMSSKLVKVTKLMDFSELKDFDFSRKYMIHGIKYLVASIQVTIKRDRIMPAVLECYPCP